MPGQVSFDQCIGSEESRSANRRLGRSLEVFLPDFVEVIEVSQIPQEDLNLKSFAKVPPAGRLGSMQAAT
jgi:hypothetical protein